MSESVSALQGAISEGSVRVEEAGLCGMITLKGDLSDKILGKAVRDVTGVAVPAPGTALFGETGPGGQAGALWMAPDELLLMVCHDEADGAVAKIDTTLAGTHFLAANVSDARALFRLTGPRVREVLARLTPADLRPARFETGHVRRTRVAQIPAAIWLAEDGTGHLVCFRSVAQYAFDLLTNASEHAQSPDFF